MALTFGFYDSVNGDRSYTAKQFSQFFDGILSDGVFESIGDAFEVTAASGMTVNVGTGRAWLNSKWVLNDSSYPVTIDTAEPILNRIDSIAFAVDEPTRTVSIIAVKGTPASTPSAPTLTNTSDHFEYKIADIYVAATATSITNDNISDCVGTGSLPYTRMVMDTLFFSDATPLMDGSAKAGTLRTYARGDHRHPTDTSRQAKIMVSGILQGDGSGNITGVQIGAAYASDTVPKMDGVATVGTETTFSRGDHKHPTDTSREKAKTKTTVTVPATGWSNNAITVTVSGVTASNTVMVSPDPASWDVAKVAEIYASAQASNSLTFKCTRIPTAAVTMNVIIWS